MCSTPASRWDMLARSIAAAHERGGSGMESIIDGIKDWLLIRWGRNPWGLIFLGFVVVFFIGIMFKKLLGIGGKKKDS